MKRNYHERESIDQHHMSMHAHQFRGTLSSDHVLVIIPLREQMCSLITHHYYKSISTDEGEIDTQIHYKNYEFMAPLVRRIDTIDLYNLFNLISMAEHYGVNKSLRI